MRQVFTLIFVCTVVLSAFGQATTNQLFQIDTKGINQQINLNKSKEISLVLPLPNGAYHQFRATPNQVLSPSLQAQYPDLHSFNLRSETHPNITGKLTFGANTVYAILETPNGMVTITPSVQEKTLYKSYYGNNDPELEEEEKNYPVECGQHSEAPDNEKKGPGSVNLQKSGGGFTRGATIRTYRVAIVGTGEFFAANGASQMAAMTVITNTINGWNIIYKKDLAVEFTLVLTQIYENAATDPFQPDTQMGALSRTNQAQNALNANFNIDDYDLGHVFHKTTNNDGWSGGGVAQLRCVCTASKGRAWSGSFNNTSNGWIRLSAHEAGHQFGANHTFNGTGSSCTNNIAENNSYEIGSGTTIMSYQGICQADNNIPSSGVADNYFHAASISEMVAYISTGNGMNCGTNAGANSVPVINTDPCTAGTITIPKNTPFELTGSATDADNDALTYCWEQFNEDDEVNMPNSTATQGKIGAAAGEDEGAPLFRSYPPTSTPVRTFPIIDNIINGVASDFEVLPTVARTMKFALTVRDGKGGIVCANRDVTVSANGPFTVTAPVMNASLAADGITDHTITWSKGGFTGCTKVNIKLSIDGGKTYPITLAADVPYGAANDPQSTTLKLPNTLVGTMEARIKVECADNNCATFFNISPQFTITSPCMAGESNVFPTTAQTFNSGSVDLDWTDTGNRFYSSVATSVTANMTNADLGPQSPVANAQGSNTCQAVSFSDFKHKVYTFKVDQTGNYTFSRSSVFAVLTIFENFTAYNGSNACASGTFLASNVYPDNPPNYTGQTSVSLELTADTTYTLLVGRDNNESVTVSFSGPGSVLLQEGTGAGPGMTYSYTYVLVSDADGLIKGVSPTADFGTSGTYVAGNYKVYGISYLTMGATPNNWIGESIGAVNGTVCLRQSSNFKPLTFTAALPVELLAFNGEAMSDYNRLQWVTASEENNAGFEVQRSKDANAWETLDFVKGYGTTIERQQYKYKDLQPMENVSYYRLKQIDNDGAFEYSDIISLTRKTDAAKELVVYPNPTRETITFELGGVELEKYTFQLVDPLGRVLNTWTALEGTTYSVAVENLSDGFYTLVAKGTNNVLVKRFVKQ